MSEPDDDLKALYARQRAANEERVLEFQAMRARALESGFATRSDKPAILRWAWPLTAATAVLVGVVAFLATLRSPTPRALASQDEAVRQIEQIDAALKMNLAEHQSITAWQSPTDFLLKPINTEIP
ncbi:MAG TPA: hypothetical protein VGM54_13895 [Chthoniobacter sp.]|jgi:hypothetical protein